MNAVKGDVEECFAFGKNKFVKQSNRGCIAEFSADVRTVNFNGTLRKFEQCGDVAIFKPAADQHKNLPFTFRE